MGELGLALGGCTGTGTISSTPKRRRHRKFPEVNFGSGMRAMGANGEWIDRDRNERRLSEHELAPRRLERQIGTSAWRHELTHDLNELGGSGHVGGAGCSCPTGAPCSCHHVDHHERRVVHRGTPWPAEVLKDPGRYGLRVHGPSYSHNDRALPHPLVAGASFWLWHPEHRRYVHIRHVVHHHSGSHLVDPQLLPSSFPDMEVAPAPDGIAPPPPPAQVFAHVPIVVPVSHDHRVQRDHVVRRHHEMSSPLHPADHLAELPGHWRLLHGAWLYCEPQKPVLGGATSHEVQFQAAQAPAAAFEPRPLHLPPQYFWPDPLTGAMTNAAGQHPSNAPTTVPLPGHLRLLRSKVPAAAVAGATAHALGGQAHANALYGKGGPAAAAAWAALTPAQRARAKNHAWRLNNPTL